VVVNQSGWEVLGPRALPPEWEKAWFLQNKNALAARHTGFYVAVYGQGVVDSDRNLAALVNRFFSEHGLVDAYFGFVGKEPPKGVASV
jgi:hypothetical protein